MDRFISNRVKVKSIWRTVRHPCHDSPTNNIHIICCVAMPSLKKAEPHQCLTCGRAKPFPSRGNLKKHLTLCAANGKPRCSGLKSVISAELWKGIVSHYTNDAPLPDLSQCTKKKPKLSPLKDLTPGSRHITRRLKNAPINKYTYDHLLIH